jgi:hypothetical protein
MKKIISFLFILTIALTAIASTTAEAAVKISKSKATLEVDATLQLKIPGSESSIKWTSSKEAIATVNSKGIVTAVKAGTATITATVDSIDYSCSVYVVNSKSVNIAVGETKEYTSGEYIVGEDIPAGTYTITATNGYGSFEVYASEKEYDDGKYKTQGALLTASKDSSFSNVYKNMKLKKGQYVVIDSSMTVELKRTK